MALRRRPSLPRGGRDRFRGASHRPLLLLLTLLLLVPACQSDDDELLKPGEVASNIITAFYVPSDEFEGHEIEMDGAAKDTEWGGRTDTARPYIHVRLTSEDGAGDPGAPVYASVKAVYTDTDIFFLFRWVDDSPDMWKDALYYVGPDLIDSVGLQPGLLDESSWARETMFYPRQDEDRFTVAFDMEPTGDALGTFREQGCLVACHLNQTPAFGTPTYGRLDVWQWLACRTNQVRRTYTPTDDANFPAFAIPGYLDDYVVDPVGGLAPDPGLSCWFPNTLSGSNRPRWIYRPADDPFNKPADPDNCLNDFYEDCRVNNGLGLYYLWREDIERIPLESAASDTINSAVPGRDARKWMYGDIVTAFYYTYPTESRADVRGKAVFDQKAGVWTLEVGRPLRTSDTINDVQFTGAAGSEFVFTLAIANNSADRHWGSGPQVLRFGPKTRVPAGASGNGDGR